MRPEEKSAKKEYDFMAGEYHNMRTKKYPQGWFYNEMLEMPSVIELLGNVKGKKILDLGCGTGIYAKLLTKRGAIVKGFDISPEMIKIAKQENPGLDLKIGSAYDIPFDEKFDIVLASLVVHYIEDWDKMFSEIKRVLKNNGLFIFSTGNPVSEFPERVNVGKKTIKTIGDYFKEGRKYAVWKNINGKNLKVFSYHITYETLIKRILKNGFEIIDYKDTFPLKKSKKLFPGDYNEWSKKPFFSVWKIRLK
jgi:SAM-dependent methyltransferase